MKHRNMESRKLVGQTAATGFQIGVRRTFPISPERVWSFLTSPEGTKLWLGNVSPPAFNEGEIFASEEGISGELRVVKPLRQLRLKWGRKDWAKPSTLQIRLISSDPDRTTISFHQENLDHPNTREQMKLHWENVLSAIWQKTSIVNDEEEMDKHE